MLPQVPLAQQAMLPLLAACSVKVVAAVVAALLVQAVQAVQVVVVQVAVAAERAAARTLREPVALAATAGHWYWSIDHGSICFD